MTDWKYEEEPMAGDMRVWCMVNVPTNTTRYATVHSPEEAVAVINAEAKRQLEDPNITTNVFGLEIYKDSEWEEWEDECGDNIDVQLDDFD